MDSAPSSPSTDLAAAAADLMVSEITAQPAARAAKAATMGNTEKANYCHADMIDFIIMNPMVTQRDLAARYGYTEGWISNVMASDAWQSLMAKRRAEIVDPVLVAGVEERFRMITVRSQERLMEKLNAPVVSDNVVLKAMELGAKALGVGGNAPPVAPPQDHLASLANRLLDLQANVRRQVGVTLNGESTVVPEGG